LKALAIKIPATYAAALDIEIFNATFTV
jgi:hypothetical protein